MTSIFADVANLAEQINHSTEAKEYRKYKVHLQEHAEVQQLLQEFQRVKDDFAEAQRFGIFHPNYHEAKAKAQEYQQRLNTHPVIAQFRQAEEQLDQLLHQVSLIIAHSVSESIKVPSNQLQKQTRNQSCSR